MDRNTVDHDTRMAEIADRLQERFADAEGRHASRREIVALVHQKASEFVGARLQDFVPLLVEHRAADALRDRGMRPVLASEPTVPTPDDSRAGLRASSINRGRRHRSVFRMVG